MSHVVLPRASRHSADRDRGSGCGARQGAAGEIALFSWRRRPACRPWRAALGARRDRRVGLREDAAAGSGICWRTRRCSSPDTCRRRSMLISGDDDAAPYRHAHPQRHHLPGVQRCAGDRRADERGRHRAHGLRSAGYRQRSLRAIEDPINAAIRQDLAVSDNYIPTRRRLRGARAHPHAIGDASARPRTERSASSRSRGWTGRRAAARTWPRREVPAPCAFSRSTTRAAATGASRSAWPTVWAGEAAAHELNGRLDDPAIS